jgi:hypothetical protein
MSIVKSRSKWLFVGLLLACSFIGCTVGNKEISLGTPLPTVLLPTLTQQLITKTQQPVTKPVEAFTVTPTLYPAPSKTPTQSKSTPPPSQGHRDEYPSWN